MNNQWYYPAYYWLPTWQPREGFHHYQGNVGHNGIQPYWEQGFNSEGVNSQQMPLEGYGWESQRDNNNEGYVSQIQQQNTNAAENNSRGEALRGNNAPSIDFRDQYTKNVNHGSTYDINKIISIDAAINIARGKFAGEVVRAELDKQNPAWVYRVDYITSDDIKDTIEVDVHTGNII